MGAMLPRCQAPASPCLQGNASPGGGRTGEAQEQQRPGRGALHPQEPTWGERAGTQLGAWGTVVFPPPKPHPRATPKSPSMWGERKGMGSAGGWCFTSWHSLASSSSEAGVPEPSPSPPGVGQAHPWSERSDSDPGPVPSWLNGHAIFCLKRKRFTQGKTSKGPSLSHPHTNRFI